MTTIICKFKYFSKNLMQELTKDKFDFLTGIPRYLHAFTSMCMCLYMCAHVEMLGFTKEE